MKLSKEEVLKLAKLSRLQLSDAEIARFQDEISAILSYVQQLDDIDTTGLSATYQVTGLTSQDDNATRDDVITEQASYESLMKNVSEQEGRHIKVKRMIA